jgi:hypothetical protein
MGAIFFMGLLAIVCILAGIFFLTGSILLIISILHKRKGKKVKRLRILAIVSYCISVIFFAVPLGWFTFLRGANQQTFENYVDTGVYVSSSASNKDTSEQFYYKGDLYIIVDNELQGFHKVFGEAVANVKESSNALLDKIFNYNSDGTIYTLKNDSGYTILSNRVHNFYKQEDQERILNYYHSLKEYKYYYLKFGTGNGVEYIDMDFNKELFDQLRGKYKSSEAEVHISDDHAVEYSIEQTSPDGIFWRDVYVLLKEDSAYVVSTSSGDDYTGYQLDKSTTNHLKSVLR